MRRLWSEWRTRADRFFRLAAVGKCRSVRLTERQPRAQALRCKQPSGPTLGVRDAYLKTRMRRELLTKVHNGGYSSLIPYSWSFAQAKRDISQAFVSHGQLPNGRWFGSSGGPNFRFFAPAKNVPLWRGYPIYTP